MKTREKQRLANLTHNFALPPEVYMLIHKLINWSNVMISPAFYNLSPMGMASNNFIRIRLPSSLSVFSGSFFYVHNMPLTGFQQLDG